METRTEPTTMTPGAFVQNYLPADTKFRGDSAQSLQGRGTVERLSLPELRIQYQSSRDGSKQTVTAPEGSEAVFYAHYTTRRNDKTIAVIFFPNRSGQIVIKGGGVVFVRRH